MITIPGRVDGVGASLVKNPRAVEGMVSLPRNTHPKLLDYLALSFVDSGWDIKAMLARMVLSATFRQASAMRQQDDPENLLLARGPSMRLSAEMLRDHALHASGLLVERIGGPSVKPYQPPGLWKEKSGRVYRADKGDGPFSSRTRSCNRPAHHSS